MHDVAAVAGQDGAAFGEGGVERDHGRWVKECNASNGAGLATAEGSGCAREPQRGICILRTPCKHPQQRAGQLAAG